MIEVYPRAVAPFRLRDQFTQHPDPALGLLMTMPGTVWFFFNTAFRPEPGEGEAPVQKALAIIHPALALAESRGYSDGAGLCDAFRDRQTPVEAIEAMLAELFRYIDPLEIVMMSGDVQLPQVH